MVYKRSLVIGGIAVLIICMAIAVGTRPWGVTKEIARLVPACDALREGAAKIQCWDKLIRSSTKRYGIDNSLELLALLYAHDGQFAQSCHAMTHTIGQAAYAQFAVKGAIPLSDKTAYCSFGFFHGFMETLIAKKGTITQAQHFCDSIDRSLGKTIPNAKLGCYHGIGHGATDVHNPAYYGNERALIVPALAICETFARTQEQLKICATGVFDSISIAYYNAGTNGLVINPEDPLWLCREQPEKYKESCYLDMMPAILWYGQYDLAKALPIVITHAEDAYVELAARSLAQASVRFVVSKAPGVSGSVVICRTAPKVAIACIGGLAEGVMQFGKPGEEYKAALSFCSDAVMTSQERDVCMKSVLSYVTNRYAKSEVNAICTQVPLVYKKYCEL